MEIIHYTTSTGAVPYAEWFDSLRDPAIKSDILRRLDRVKAGNLGDTKNCRGGVCEFRIDRGPGYRIYYARIDDRLIILLAGGNKSTQSKDIEKAVSNLADFKAAQRHDKKSEDGGNV